MMPSKPRFNVVGSSIPKVDGMSLATGSAQFTDDIELRGMLYTRLLRSPHAHARIREIDTSEAERLHGVRGILSYKNVRRVPHTTAGQGHPEPSPYDTFLFDRKVRYVGDAVAAVAAETVRIANQALQLIHVDYEILEPVFDPRQALKKGGPIIHDEPDAYAPLPVIYEPKRNLAAHVDMEVGDIETGFREADVVLDNEYTTHYGAHASLETHIVVTYLDERNRLVIRTSTQVPFHVRRIVARVLQLPVSRVRVVKPRIGGGFGGKQEMLLETICGALTLLTRRPVKLQLTREEEFMCTRARHPQHIRLKSGVKKDGSLTALDLNILMNAGAYAPHALTVVCNSGSKTLPLYRCPNIRFEGNTAYTNLPVGGAYRGYGATQAFFAMGVQMDEMARAIGMDPLTFHKRNHIRAGEGSPVFQALGEGKKGVEMKLNTCGLDECIDLGARAIAWHEKRQRRDHGVRKRGVGMVCLMQGSAIPEIDMGAATITMNDDGSFILLAGATDLGTGSDTVLAQIAAEVLSVTPDQIVVHSSDTDFTPFDVGAYASSTTYLSGNAVKHAAEQVRRHMLRVASEMLNARPSELVLRKGAVVRKKNARDSVSLSDVAHYSLYQKNQFHISATASQHTHISPPPFAAHFAEVEVDTETGEIRVLEYVAAVDCGTAINPALAEGQTEGSIVNGISFALTEQFYFDARGRMLNPNFNYYNISSARDVPPIRVILVPTHEPTGPFGAKSVAEISINGPLPTISNAVYHAVGIRLRHAPFTPQRVLDALRNQGSQTKH
jgi:putative selenate reductase molybdopterin-binding subunit